MAINLNTQTIRQLPKRAVEGINSVGEGAIRIFKEQKDSFSSSRTGEFLKNHNINKNTFVGAAILASATSLAIKCLCGIRDKVREIKE